MLFAITEGDRTMLSECAVMMVSCSVIFGCERCDPSISVLYE
jgi:hypothetical protein